MADTLLKFEYEGKRYEIESRDLTTGRLRQFKATFGKEYGAYLPFIQLLMQFDGDAVACAIWTGKQKAKEACPELRAIDFSPSDLITMQDDPEPEPEESEPEERPTKAKAKATTTPD